MIEVDRAPGIRPRPTLARTLDAAARAAVPFTFTLALVLFAAALAGLPGEAALRLALAMASVFAWSLLRPALLPPVLVFVLGMLCDLLGWLPLGAATLALLGVQAAARRLRPAGLPAAWGVFLFAAGGAAALVWAAASILEVRMLPAGPALRTWAFAAFLFPLVMLLAKALSGAAAAPERA